MATSQTQIAQSGADESDMVKWLASHFSILVLPRFMDSRYPDVEELGACEGTSQVLFLAGLRNLVLEHVCELSNQEGRFHVDPIGARGLTIRWTRTKLEGMDNYLVGGTTGSRIQFEPGDTWVTESKQTAAVFSQLSAYIKTAYPMMSIGGTPVYVGPNLSAALKGEIATLAGPQGSTVPLKPNPKCRG